MKAGRTQGAQSVRRAVAVLRILARGQERGVRLADIVDESGLTRPTAHRLLRVLLEEGAVEQDSGSRRYMIGAEVSLLGLARTARFPVRAVADPYLRHLADAVGDTVFLTIRNGFDSICIDRKTGDYPIKVLALEVGARRPLGVGVGGVVLLAGLEPAEASDVIRANVQRLEAYDLTGPRLTDQVRAARARGYAHTETGLVKGSRAVAVPVTAPDGTTIAAISVAAVADRITAARLPGLVAAMREQAARVAERLGAIAKGKARK